MSLCVSVCVCISQVGQICVCRIHVPILAHIQLVLWLLYFIDRVRPVHFVSIQHQHSCQRSILNFIMRLLGATQHIYQRHIMKCFPALVSVCAVCVTRTLRCKSWKVTSLPSCNVLQCTEHIARVLHKAIQHFRRTKKSHKNTNEKLSEKVEDFSVLYSMREEIGQPWLGNQRLASAANSQTQSVCNCVATWTRFGHTASGHIGFIWCRKCVCVCFESDFCVSLFFSLLLCGIESDKTVWCFHCAFGIIS